MRSFNFKDAPPHLIHRVSVPELLIRVSRFGGVGQQGHISFECVRGWWEMVGDSVFGWELCVFRG
jgi:hypothetical protein